MRKPRLRRYRTAIYAERALDVLVPEVPEVIITVENAMQSKRVCAILVACCIAYCSQAAPASQQTPEDLAQLWVKAIKANSTAEIRPLIHPGCPPTSISPEILARMVGGGLPETYDIESRELGPHAELERIYEVVPERQLTIKYQTNTPAEKEKYGLGKGFPIAKAAGEWFFVICLRST
jgi:hypothetical protein